MKAIYTLTSLVFFAATLAWLAVIQSLREGIAIWLVVNNITYIFGYFISITVTVSVLLIFGYLAFMFFGLRKNKDKNLKDGL